MSNEYLTTDELIMKHKIRVEPFDSIVFARIGAIECDARYRETDGDELKALQLAVKRVVERTEAQVYQPTADEVKTLREHTGRGAAACAQALRKFRGDSVLAAEYVRNF